MRFYRGLGCASLVVLAATACSPAEPQTRATPAPATSSTADPTSDPTPTPAPATRPAPKPITIAVAGDIHFEGVLRERLETPATALAPATKTLAAADLAIVNLETSVGEGGAPEPGKRYTFQAPPSAFTALAKAGIDVATMANNHALDFGRDPLPGMFGAIGDAAEGHPPLSVVGVGRDARGAFRPAYSDLGEVMVATIGATVAGEDPTADPTTHWAATGTTAGTADATDPTRLRRAVTRADRKADVVVVYLHWGIQGEGCPSESQRELAEDLIERGADIVVGSHAHRLQGDGRLGDGYVAYGLGNYAWYTQSSDVTGVLTLTVRPPRERAGRAKVTRAEWEPARIGADGLPAPMAGPAVAEFETELAALRACAGFG